MTPNLTYEERVEAAAVVAYNQDADSQTPGWDALPESSREAWRKMARAVAQPFLQALEQRDERIGEMRDDLRTVRKMLDCSDPDRAIPGAQQYIDKALQQNTPKESK